MKRKKRFERKQLRRGIYLLPNVFTSLNLFCGFFAVVASINGRFAQAAVAIVVAGVFDNLDGKIARATNTTSKFGIEYDSLADLVSFGMAPAVMMYLWALQPLGRIGWLAAFLFVACGALRLARFNTQAGTVSGDHFVGLPIPGAAGMNAVTVLICNKFHIGGDAYPVVMLIMLYLLSFLMVSSIAYPSFKKLELFRKMNFNVLVATILILIFIAAQPAMALFSLGVIYTLSGPISAIRQHRAAKVKDAEAYEQDKPGSNPI